MGTSQLFHRLTMAGKVSNINIISLLIIFGLISSFFDISVRGDATASVRATLDGWSLRLVPYVTNPYTGQTLPVANTTINFEIVCAGEVNSTGGFTNFYNVSDLPLKLEISNYTLPSGVRVTKYTHSAKLPSGITVWASMEEFEQRTWKNYFGWNMSLPELGQGVKLSVGMYGVNESATAFLDETQANTTENMLFIGNRLTITFVPKFPIPFEQILDVEYRDKLPLRNGEPVPLSPQIDPDARQPAPRSTPFIVESKDVTLKTSFLDGTEIKYQGKNDSFDFIAIDVADPLLTNGLRVDLGEALLNVIYATYYGKDPATPKVAVLPYLFRLPLKDKPRVMSWEYDPDFSVLFTGTWDAPPSSNSTPETLSQLQAENQTALIAGIVVGIVIAVAIMGLIIALVLSNSLRAKLMPLYANRKKVAPISKTSAAKEELNQTRKDSWKSARSPSNPQLLRTAIEK